MRSITLLVHGDPGSGKSWLSNTAPGPRLMIDVEHRSQYLSDLRKDPSGSIPQDIVLWDPREAVPAESSDPSVLTVVDAQHFGEVELAVRHLKAGGHPFRSVTLDSLQEAQYLLLESISGVEQMRTQDWGEALRRLGALIRDLTNLRVHRTNPVDAVVVVSGTQERDGKLRPALQGQISVKVAYLFDVVGFMQKGLNAEGEKVLYMTIDGFSSQEFVTKCNLHPLSQHYGEHVVFPDVSAMLQVLNHTLTANPTKESDHE